MTPPLKIREAVVVEGRYDKAALAAAVVLVCCVATAFATSAAEKGPYPQVEEGTFTVEELDRLAGLWFQGCRDMTVADYQEKLWAERDTPEDMELIIKTVRGCFGRQ